MQLDTWLQLEEMSIKDFSCKIGKDHSLVHKYIYEDVIPKADVIRKIYKIT